jgi:D-threo-aldose 1-dehydrogenase
MEAMVDPTRRRSIGPRGLSVTQLGFGGGTLGDPDEITSDQQAHATLAAAYDAGVRYFDTAPWYGNTKSEHRVGQFLRGKPREEFVLSTKVGRLYSRPQDPARFAETEFAARWKGGLPFVLRFDYTREGIARSYADSLQRLGLNRVDCLVIHDVDPRHQKNEDGVARALAQLDAGGGYAELDAMRARGEIAAIGAGVNHTGMIPRFLERFDLDYFLIAMPYTLLDQEALDGELAMCEARGVKVVIGAVFASGILATGANDHAQYRYQAATAEVLQRVARIQAVCDAHDVPLGAAALQFPLAHPCVSSVIPGANSPAQVADNLSGFAREIPAAFWRSLREQALVHPDAPLPGDA